jgi:hypothetical protein
MMGMESILGMLGMSGLSSSTNMPLSAAGPTLNELTLNPDILGGVPTQIPYQTGQGPFTMRSPATPPMAPMQGGPTEKATSTETGGSGKPAPTWQDQLTGLGKTIISAANASKSMENSPLAQRMFQENNAKQMQADQMNKYKIEQFRRHDMSSQILEKYGLL